MGTCASTSADQAVHPIKPIKMPSVLFQSKHKFPVKEIAVPHGATANGKITDLVIANKNLREMEYSDLYQRVTKMKTGAKYSDEEFPTTQKSIGSLTYSKNVQWKRPETFIKGALSVFEGKIEAKDIRQGRLGNCYLMSALILISDHPEIVRRLFEKTEINELGMYGIWLNVDGEWKIIIIDDFIPTEESRTLFSRNNGPELWVVLLEKAYAKAYECYSNIEKGLVGVAVQALTGAPYEYFQKDSKTRDPKSKAQANELWNFIKKQDALGRMLAGSSELNDRNDNLNLVSQHAYAILDIQEISIKTKKGDKVERLLKLANPWGQFEWQGNWSDKSPLWTPELKEKLKMVDAQDGTFWMNIEDFHQNFGQVCSSKYDKDYVYSYAKLKFNQQPRGFKGVSLNLKRKTKGFLNLIQKDHRCFKQYRYALIRVIVLQINSTTRHLEKYIDDMMDCDRDTCLEVNLEPGEYYIAIQADWSGQLSRQLVISFYGQHGVELVEDTEPTASYDSFLNQIVLLHELYTEKERIHEYSNDVNIKRVTGSIAGYVYYHYKNDSKEEKYLSETVVLKQHKFIKVYNEEKPDEFSVKVLPGEEKIVKLRVESEGNGYYSYSTKIQFYVVEGYTRERLRELCDKKPTKIKKREVQGKPIDVIVKTFSYSGGIAVLYQNKMDKYAFIEELTLDIENLELENEILNKKNQIEIELEPQSEKLLSFLVSKPGLPVVFRTTMSFYLNSPEFKF